MLVAVARPRRGGSRRRAAAVLVAAVAFAGLPPLALSAPASAVEGCTLVPQLSDVMVSQGLPTYKDFAGDGKRENKLVRGKTTLVKYFLRLPGCAPDTTDVRVVSGQLFTTISPARIDANGKLVLPPPSDLLGTATPTGALPAPPVGPTATAPVPGATSDPLFVVPGSALRPSSADPKRVYFAAVLQYTVDGGAAQTLNLLAVPATGDLVSRVVDVDVRPMRVLAVPMGDAGTAARPKTYESQFPDAARVELERGMQSLSRLLPVPDYAGAALSSTAPGLRVGMSAGLLNLGDHTENGRTVSYMPNDSAYCGSLAHTSYVFGELQKRRTAHNSVNPQEQAEFAYGVIWQDRSLGAVTGTKDPLCAEGAGAVPGRTAWGRLIAPVPEVRPGVSGAIAAMELSHNAGLVDPFQEPDRTRPGYHSRNLEADVSAPDRAWNTLDRSWIAVDRSVMNDSDLLSWNDANTLLEKQDWDAMHCLLTTSACATGATIGVGAAGAGAGTFYLAGSFTGYDDEEPGNEQADVSSYHLPSGQPEPASSSSPYVFVQRDGERILSSQGIPVSAAVDDHDHGDQVQTHGSEVFGVQLAASPGANRIQVYRGTLLLHERFLGEAPQFLSASVANRTASVSATDDRPQDLRLDVFLSCPERTSPLSVDVHPVVAGRVATFTTTYDTGLGCGQAGRLLYRVNDGYATTTRSGLTDIADGRAVSGVAAISAPTAGADVLQFASMALAGAGRDATGQPADRLEWRIAPEGTALPQEPTFIGATGSVAAPGTGFLTGRHAVQLRAFRSGTLVGQAASVVTVLADRDADGLPDLAEPACVPGAVADARNAARDSDGDGTADVVDVSDLDGNGVIDVRNEFRPCASSATAVVTFDPQKLQKSSQGTPVTVRLTSSTTDLAQLKASGAQLFIHQIAGYRVSIPADSWSVVLSLTGPVAEAKFSREAVLGAVRAGDVLGYAPVFVGTADRALYGADPKHPVVFP